MLYLKSYSWFLQIQIRSQQILLLFFHTNCEDTRCALRKCLLIWSSNDTQSICTLLNVLTGYGPLFHLKAELQWGHFSLFSSVKRGSPSVSDPSSYSELFVSSIGSYTSSEWSNSSVFMNSPSSIWISCRFFSSSLSYQKITLFKCDTWHMTHDTYCGMNE